MNCEEFKNLISSYIEGDCSKNAEFERHMDGCPQCREALEQTKKIMALCAALPEQPLPQGFEARLHQRLTQEAKPKKSILLQWRQYKRGFVVGTAVAAASLVLVATPFLGLYQESGEVPQQPVVDTGNVQVAVASESPDVPTGLQQTPGLETQQPSESGMVQQPQQTAVMPPEATANVATTDGQTAVQPGGDNVALPPQQTTAPSAPGVSQQVQQPDYSSSVQDTQQPTVTQQPEENTNQLPQEQTAPASVEPNAAGTLAVAGEQDMVASGGSVGGGSSNGENSIASAAVRRGVTVVRVVASADNVQWIQEHAAGYGERQSVNGMEIVALSQEEYQVLLESSIAWESVQQVPAEVESLLESSGYYLILE